MNDTMDYGIAFAETGHLCFSTLHANSANQALDRIINFFPEERRQQLLMDLSLNLKAFVSQRLIPNKTGKGRVAAVEIMLNSPFISDLIFKGDVHEIKEVMARSRELGMQTFDQSLYDLYEAGLITYEDALRNADSLNDLRLRIKLHGQESKDRDMMSGLDHLDISEIISHSYVILHYALTLHRLRERCKSLSPDSPIYPRPPKVNLLTGSSFCHVPE